MPGEQPQLQHAQAHAASAIDSKSTSNHQHPLHAACDALGGLWQRHVAPRFTPPPPTHHATQNPLAAPPRHVPVSREELGRSTWVLLHTLAAQLPDKPTRQQQRDVRTLIDVLTRIYPCGDCASHWSHIVRAEPPRVQSRQEFEQWLCRVHNVVNRSLGKPMYNCKVVGLRWSALDCTDHHAVGCAIGGVGQQRR